MRCSIQNQRLSMKKFERYESIKRIDLTDRELASNRSQTSSVKSLRKRYSHSKSSNKDRIDNYGFVTERSRQAINQFNPSIGIGQSPQRISDLISRPVKSNIKTYVRFRPICKSDLLKQQPNNSLDNYNFLKYQISDERQLLIQANKEKQLKFSFDKIFDSSTAQMSIYQETTQQLVGNFVNGYNVTMFAYGQTGSGKTYTMLGDNIQSSNKGVIMRAVQQIFEKIGSQTSSYLTSNLTSNKSSKINILMSPQKSTNITLSCSLVQIYKQNLVDLFNTSDLVKDLRIKQNVNGEIDIDGLTINQVTNQQEVLKLLETGIEMRKIRGTDLNDNSSRSHLIFTIYLKTKVSQTSYRISKFNLVDLAGSEKVSKTKVNGEGLQEAKKINLSLSCLGNTINALSKCQQHIPFRDSKLTRILQQSLSGNSVTRVIITCSILQSSRQETISSLKFGHRLKQIKLQPTQTKCKLINQNSVNKHVYNALLSSYQETESKLCKIKEIVACPKKLYEDDIIDSVLRIIESTNVPKQDTEMLEILGKVAESETVSINNEPTLHSESRAINQKSQAQLLEIIKQKQMMIEKQRFEIQQLNERINQFENKQKSDQTNERKVNKIKLMKQRQLKPKAIQVDEATKQNIEIDSKKIGREGLVSALVQIKQMIDKFWKQQHTLERMQQNVLEKQIAQLINKQANIDINQGIKQMKQFRKDYIQGLQTTIQKYLQTFEGQLQKLARNQELKSTDSNPSTTEIYLNN